VADDADRTTAKGAARRSAIVSAAAALVVDGGPDAVSHRAVAREAGVPLAATTYYFAGLDELLAAAVELVADADLRVAAAVVEALPPRRRSPAATAEVVVDVLLGRDRRDDAHLQAYYERFLAAGRYPALRPVLRSARARVDAMLTEVLRRCGYAGADVGTLVALADGTVLSALVEGDGRARQRARDAVAAGLSAG
jgi:DNA-binding transcriptional regulator YbjK